jgi:hypothetical protein
MGRESNEGDGLVSFKEALDLIIFSNHDSSLRVSKQR